MFRPRVRLELFRRDSGLCSRNVHDPKIGITGLGESRCDSNGAFCTLGPIGCCNDALHLRPFVSEGNKNEAVPITSVIEITKRRDRAAVGLKVPAQLVLLPR